MPASYRPRPIVDVVRLQAERMAGAVEEIESRLLGRVLRHQPELQQLASDDLDRLVVDLEVRVARPHQRERFVLRREHDVVNRALLGARSGRSAG